MKNLSLIVSLAALLSIGIAHAKDGDHPRKEKVKANIEKKAENNCNGNKNCEAREEKWMGKRAETMHDEVQSRCNGDKDCEAKARDYAKDKRDALRNEVQEKCPNGGDECKRQVVKNRAEHFEENHPALTDGK